MRVAIAVLAAAAAALAASDSSADDAPPKAGGPKPLRISLASDKTYVYQLRESISDRQVVDAGAADTFTLDARAEVVWDAGVSLQRVQADGNVIVSLLVERVRGSCSAPHDAPLSFDSDDPKSPLQSDLVGHGIVVTLSPTGRVVDALGPRSVLREVQIAPGKLAPVRLGLDDTIVKPFVQQFFHELPDPAPRARIAWDQTRALAPSWIAMAPRLVGNAFGDAVEKTTVTKVATDVVAATFRARGERDASAPPKDRGRMTTSELLGERLDEWMVLGEISIRRDTGLVASRTSTTTLLEHWDSISVPRNRLPPIVGLPDGDLVTSPTDHHYEISSQLDLVDVR